MRQSLHGKLVMGRLYNIVKYAPPAWTLYPFLVLFQILAIANGAYEAGLEADVIGSAKATAETTGAVNTIIQYVPEPSKQLEALGDIKI